MIGRCRLANPTIRKGILCYLSGCYRLRSQLSLDAGESVFSGFIECFRLVFNGLPCEHSSWYQVNHFACYPGNFEVTSTSFLPTDGPPPHHLRAPRLGCKSMGIMGGRSRYALLGSFFSGFPSAATEGEGDGSLRYWREVHWAYFGRVCKRIRRVPSPRMPIVCERFEVIYRGVPPERAA